jgi:outer membrane lipoprotein SlyB
MLTNKFGLALCFLCSFLFSGCSDRFSGDMYNENNVGEVARTETGHILSLRKVKLKPDSSPEGAALGAVGGALTGSLFGGGRGKVLTAGSGALVGGVLGNSAATKAVDGVEYTIKLDRGSIVTIAQGVSPALSVGQKVYVVNSNRGRSRVIAA